MWWVYLVRCEGGALYTGISTDVKRRILEHNSGKGSKSLRGRLPVVLVYQEKTKSRSSALKREAAIKGWPRSRKLELAGIMKRGTNSSRRRTTRPGRRPSREKSTR